MSNSNAKNIRKLLAKEIEAELLTIETDLNNLDKIGRIDYKGLKKLKFEQLKYIRISIQRIQSQVKNINNYTQNIEKPSNGDVIVRCDDKEVYVVPFHYKELEAECQPSTINENN